MTQPGRAVGIDLGSRRIGVAVSDSDGVLATPYGLIQRAPDLGTDHAALARVVSEIGATVVVVGLPLSLSGYRGPAAHAVVEEVELLRPVLPVPVELVDERLSTVAAGRSLQSAGVKGLARRRVIDQTAAAVILQTWLDGHR